MKKALLALGLLLALTGCAGYHSIVRIACEPLPTLLSVRVYHGTIKGKDLDHVIENQTTLWERLHLDERLGCIAK